MSSAKRESVRVLEECIELQLRKSNDYQNPNSNIVQAMHYRRGVSTIHDMIWQKLLRAQSLLEMIENNSEAKPNFESLEDTYKDLINYASFAVAYLRGKMEGQDPYRDMLNRNMTEEEKVRVADKCIREMLEEDTSGGSSSGQVSDSVSNQIEDDGFITMFPPVARTYVKNVLPRGEVRLPRGEVNCTDPVQNAYVDRVRNKSKSKRVKDIGDRIEGEYDELAKKHSEK